MDTSTPWKDDRGWMRGPTPEKTDTPTGPAVSVERADATAATPSRFESADVAVENVMEATPARTEEAAAPPVSPDDLLHAEYAWAWALHALVPLADKVLGVAGAMDQRPLGTLDWYLRLPLVLLVLALPRNKEISVAAHMLSIAFWFARMPAVWDYMCWVAITEMCYVAAVLGHRGGALMRSRFLPAVRATLTTLYFSAAFWKLTTSFMDPKVSCANTLVAELAAALFGDGIPADSAFARGLMASAPAQIVAIEFLVPALQAAGSGAAVPVALLFHFAINLMPVTYAGGFSIAMCVRQVVFLPGSLLSAFDPAGAAGAGALFAVAAAAYLHAHRGALDSAGALFMILGYAYCRAAIFVPAAPAEEEPPTRSETVRANTFLRRAFIGLAFVYGFLAPIFGVMAMASSSMYGNLRQFDGVHGNHLLVPTGLLQRWCRDLDPRSPLGLFSGGMVRLELAGTKGSVFDELYFDADITHEQPPHARAILSEAVDGNPGRYFEFYAARNYFNRAADHGDTALHNEKAGELASAAPREPRAKAFAMPAYELRRAIALAKRRGEPFTLRYSKLSTATPSEWRLEKPTYRDTVKYSFPADKCVDGIYGWPCKEDALPLLPPPPAWLTYFLHPYPTPLLDDGSGDEIHCTT